MNTFPVSKCSSVFFRSYEILAVDLTCMNTFFMSKYHLFSSESMKFQKWRAYGRKRDEWERAGALGHPPYLYKEISSQYKFVVKTNSGWSSEDIRSASWPRASTSLCTTPMNSAHPQTAILEPGWRRRRWRRLMINTYNYDPVFVFQQDRFGKLLCNSSTVQ